jgi:hypothetical protein
MGLRQTLSLYLPHPAQQYLAHSRTGVAPEKADPARPKIFLTEPGIGYRLVTE